MRKNIKKFLFRSLIKTEQFLSASKILMTSTGRAKNVFFPGCSLTGYNPDYVFATRDYIQEKLGECGIITACCSKPSRLIGNSKTFERNINSVIKKLDLMGAENVITACQNCYNTLKKYDKNRNILSLWSLMSKMGISETLENKFLGFEAAIQDSCTSTEKIIFDVRKILEYLGVNVKKFPGKKLKCCGGSQMLITCDSDLGHEYMRKRASESPCPVIISYCSSCRSAMSIDGKHKSIHILDLIFGNGEESIKKSNFLNRFNTAKKLKEM